MKYIVRAKEIFSAVEQLADALGERNYLSIGFTLWKIGDKTYRILEPTECRVVANFRPEILYEYEIEEIGTK